MESRICKVSRYGFNISFCRFVFYKEKYFSFGKIHQKSHKFTGRFFLVELIFYLCEPNYFLLEVYLDYTSCSMFSCLFAEFSGIVNFDVCA